MEREQRGQTRDRHALPLPRLLFEIQCLLDTNFASVIILPRGILYSLFQRALRDKLIPWEWRRCSFSLKFY